MYEPSGIVVKLLAHLLAGATMTRHNTTQLNTICTQVPVTDANTNAHRWKMRQDQAETRDCHLASAIIFIACASCAALASPIISITTD